jgi:hypothetical protein
MRSYLNRDWHQAIGISMKTIASLVFLLSTVALADDRADFVGALAKSMAKQGRENAEREYGQGVFAEACKTTISLLHRDRINHLQRCISKNQAEVDSLPNKLFYNHKIFSNIRHYAALTGLDDAVMSKALSANKQGHDLGQAYWYFLNVELNNDGRASAVIYEEYLSMIDCKKMEVERIYYANCSDFLIPGTEIQSF